MRLTLNVADRKREVLIYHPPSLREPIPVVMVLHGAGASPEWMLDETRFAALADRDGFLLVLPEGLTTQPQKLPKFLTNPQRWNDGSPVAREWTDAPDDVAFIQTVLDELPFSIDPKRIYLTGFSNGAAMTFRAAAALPGRFAAIAPVAGHCYVDRPSIAIPTLYLIGSDDPLIPLAGGEVVTPWKRTETKPSVQSSLDQWNAMTGSVPVVEIIDGLGHHWPGGLGRLSERIGGNPTSTVDATERIWRFFTL